MEKGKKLYVGNLEWSVTDEELLEYFKQYGEVISASVILVRDTGRSRGFGFVEMASKEDAENAIKTLDGTQFKNRPLIVREAIPEGEKRFDNKGKLAKIIDFFKKAKSGEELEIREGRKNFVLTRTDTNYDLPGEVPIDYK